MRSMATWVVVVAVLGAGGCKRSDAPPPPPPQMPVPMPQGGMPPPGATAGGGVAPAREIPMLEDLLARDPKNRAAWVQLGNDYFDTHQPQKAIAAYEKALELKRDDPDVLTDQGVMYREVKDYDNALAKFEEANRVAPSHLTSLFNQGVVWAYDKKDAKKAAAIWRRVIQQEPNGPNGTKARQALSELEGGGSGAGAGGPPR